MATNTKIANNTNRAQFETLLKRWEGRWRLRRIVLYLPRVLMVAIGVGILTTLILGIFRVVPPTMMMMLVGGGIVAVAVIVSSALGLFGKHGIEAARHFDTLFGLQERITTALELIEGRIQSAPELMELQIADAMNRAKDVDPRKHIKIEVKWLEWLGVAVLTLILVLMLGVYVLFAAPRSGASDATQTAVQQASDDVRDTMEDVATNSALTPEERDSLLESLEVTLDDLSEEDTTAEDGFVAMSELESDLSEMADDITDEIAADEAALQAAAEALQNPSESGASGEQSLSETMEAMQESIGEMSSEELAEMQEQLMEAADLLEEEFPELAEQLREMAQANPASQQNQPSAEDFNEAQQNAQSAERNIAERQELADNLSERAEQAQNNADQIAQSENQDQQQGDQSQQQQPNQQGQEQQQQDGEQQGGQPAQSGQPPQQQGQANQQGQDGQQQQGEADSAVQSQSPEDADTVMQGPDGESSQMSSEAESEEGGEGSGSGDAEATSRQEGLSNVEEQGGSNDADGEGEITYEEIYSPNDINTEGSGNVILEPDASDSPSVEGDFQDNPDGSASVPYNQVFRSYENAANRALENDYVPLGMQDVVRDYFSSLQPEGEASQP